MPAPLSSRRDQHPRRPPPAPASASVVGGNGSSSGNGGSGNGNGREPGSALLAGPSLEVALRIPDLWQQQAVTALRAGRDVVVHAPTGAGKTYVFELLYPTLRGQAVFTVPTRALANDKLAEWRAAGWDVGICTGDVADRLHARVVVATLETQRERLLRRAGPRLLVIDEYQMLGDPHRGAHYELALALAAPETQLLLLSGSVANPAAVAEWLRRLGRDVALVTHPERPVPLEEAVLEALPFRVDDRIRGYWPRLLARALLADLAPVLIFTPRRQASEELARELAGALPLDDPLPLTGEQAALAGENLAKLLRRRVAYHHSGLSYGARAGVVEPLAKAGQLRAVVATTGLAAGVNFSLRSVLVTDTRYAVRHCERHLLPEELLQMFGRAGRRGLDTCGYVLVAPGRPRLEDARPRQLKRAPRVDWPTLLAVATAAADRGEPPWPAAVRLCTSLFSAQTVPLGVEDSLADGPRPCGLWVDAERARLARPKSVEVFGSGEVWEPRGEAAEATLDELWTWVPAAAAASAPSPGGGPDPAAGQLPPPADPGGAAPPAGGWRRARQRAAFFRALPVGPPGWNLCKLRGVGAPGPAPSPRPTPEPSPSASASPAPAESAGPGPEPEGEGAAAAGDDWGYGRELPVAVALSKQEVQLVRSLRPLLAARGPEWQGPNWPRQGRLSWRQFEERVRPALASLGEAEGGGVLHAIVERNRVLTAQFTYGGRRFPVRRDRAGRALLDPPERRNYPVCCQVCERRPLCEGADPAATPALAWRQLGLTAPDGTPTRRGRIFSFFQHGEGLAVAAALEDPAYPVEELVYDLANLRAGPRFAGEGEDPRGGRLAARCLGVYGRADFPGYLEMGVPPDYGDGANAALREWLTNPGGRHRLLSDMLRAGDLERARTEWRSLLRTVAAAPDLPPGEGWPRWDELRAAARQYVDLATPATVPVFPALSAAQLRRYQHRLPPPWKGS